MTLWGALLALAWEQVAPLFRPSQLERLYGSYADWLYPRVNAGTRGHGLLAWALAALAPALAVGLVGGWLAELFWPLGLAWSALVLYRCLGFRQPFDQARAVTDALMSGDPGRARDKLAALGGEAGPEPEDVAHAAIGRLFQLALERLFGVLLWFILLGPFGAAAYALTRLLAERWRGEVDFHAAIAQVVSLLDWLPARLMALSFAVVGNFEEAMVAWRSRVAVADPYNEGVVRAAGLGALGLDGEAAGPEYVAGTVGLLNRAVLLWLGVLGLLWLGGL
ncbi:MAG: regulatory signaling modulator protein AmpE [Thiobacillus sp.]|nr:regulatory signaling modulator protein AmpE [Thiobacillus sp.]